jgi:branched-chain amino acid transport system permease protein
VSLGPWREGLGRFRTTQGAGRIGALAPAAGPLLALAALVVGSFFLFAGTYVSTILEDALVFAIAAMGLDLLGGFGGLISLGQAAFLGVGAYGVAIAEAHGFGPWPAVGIALGVVLGVALVAAVVAVRVSGISFVIITLAIGQILWGLSYEWTSLTSGDNGVPVTTNPSIGSLDLTHPEALRAATLVVFLVVMGLLLLVTRSPFGLSLRGLRANERRLQALGYRSAAQRYLGFVLSAFVAGIAGVLYAFANHLMSPTAMDFSQDGFLVIMVVVGGLGTIWGPVLGAVLVVLFQQEISIYLSRWETVMGLVFIAAVIFTPEGIAGLVRRGLALLRRLGPSGPAPAAAEVRAKGGEPAPASPVGVDETAASASLGSPRPSVPTPEGP